MVEGLSGVRKLKRTDNLQVGQFVIVDFSAAGSKRQKLLMGRVEAQRKSGYEGVFMRNSSSDGSIFSFPAKEDRCSFILDNIKGTVDPPVPQRRGTWKFVGVNAKEW